MRTAIDHMRAQSMSVSAVLVRSSTPRKRSGDSLAQEPKSRQLPWTWVFLLLAMFTGDFKQRAKVSLGGRSRKEDSRDAVLEQARVQREQRKRQKLEDGASKTIQVRGCRGASCTYARRNKAEQGQP